MLEKTQFEHLGVLPDAQEGRKERSIDSDFKWTDVLISNEAGSGDVMRLYQRRTLLYYGCVAGSGLLAFYKLQNPSLRAAGVGLLFPGAGLLAVGTVPSVTAFLISTALVPVVMFLWFACGGIAFPILLWSGSTVLAALLARDSVFELSAPLWVTLLSILALYTRQKWNESYEAAKERAKTRNGYLIEAVQKIQTASAPEPSTREVSERELRFVQWMLELGLAGKDDWSHHDVIDQFQTSSIRYQLYDAIAGLGVYQAIVPNFHGVLSEAQRNLIEKSLTTKVMGFWKWESILGKFKFEDWDPIKKDNIMVSGYILQAASIYQANTGDDRYSKDGALVFEVTKDKKYTYDLRSVADAVFRNMDENQSCLYPCEPNWIYSLCNLVGISGLVISDRILGNSYSAQLKERFRSSLEKEFTRPDGTIDPIQSELTGFTIPGLAGTISDSVIAILASSYLPAIAHRNWAIIKQENLKWSKDGKLELVGLTGADKLDPGNYKEGTGCIRASVAASAAEYGDEDVRKELLNQLEEMHPVIETPSGSLRYKGLSTLGHTIALKARLCRYMDWRKMMLQGPPPNVMAGPILAVPFPEVLVAQAYSNDGESLDVVLYNGKAAGTFHVDFSRLDPGRTYTFDGQSEKADQSGKAVFKVAVGGRTSMRLEKVY